MNCSLAAETSDSLAKNEIQKKIDFYTASTFKKLVFNDIKIRTNDGPDISGTFLGIDSDSVVLIDEGKIIAVNRRRINKLELKYTVSPSVSALTGFHLGSLASAIIVNRFQHEYYFPKNSFAYMNHEEQNIFVTGIGVLVGSIFSLIDNFGNTYTFSFDKDVNSTEWSKFKTFVNSGELRKKLHISFVSSVVSSDLSSFFGDNFSHSINKYLIVPSSLNYLRRLMISYDIHENFAAGLALNVLDFPSERYNDRYESGGISVTGASFLAVGVYSPFPESWLIPKLGIGIGPGSYNISSSYSGRISVSKKSTFNAMFYAELGVNISNSLSMALCADYNLLDSIEIRVIDNYLFPKRKVSLSNYSIGLNFTYNFIY